MSVNFTGIKNMGALNIVMPMTSQQMSAMSFQVTNDDSGNDLDNFKNAIEKTGHAKEYLSDCDDCLVNINVVHEPKEEEYEPDVYTYYLNGRKLAVNDNNLPVFTYLAKVTRDIPQKPDSDFRVEEDYVASKGFISRTTVGHFIRSMFTSNPNIDLGALFGALHNKDNVKASSELINDAINITMSDYFA